MNQATRSTPLFVDTNALVAVFNEDDAHHEAATDILDGIGTGEYAYENPARQTNHATDEKLRVSGPLTRK